MDIGRIATTGYLTGYETKRIQKDTSRKDFETQMGNITNTQNLVLHGFADADNGEKAIGAWADAQTGISVTVYKPQNFDEENPIYHVKIWDADGNITERMVDLSEIDSKNSDVFDMYAYSCYLSNSHKCPEAQIRFMMAQAQYQGSQKNYTFESMFYKTNWLDIVEDIMQMQYDAGNLKGYLDYKKFRDFLAQ